MLKLCTLLASCAVVACASAPTRPSEVGEPRWFKGNLHTHTLWSDGDDYPESVASWYLRNGYNFLVLSDHNVLPREERWIRVGNSAEAQAAFDKYVQAYGSAVEQRKRGDTTFVRLRMFEEYQRALELPDSFILIPGEEITEYLGNLAIHFVAANLSELIPPRGGETVGQRLHNNLDAVDAQRRRSGRSVYVQINHPNYLYSLTDQDIAEASGARFIEIYNGHPLVNNDGDTAHVGMDMLWDLAVTRRLKSGGAMIYGVATDDAHDYHQWSVKQRNPGRGWVMVRARALHADSLFQSMERGDFYASTGVRIADLQYDNGLSITIDAEPGVNYTTHFYGTRSNGRPGELLAELKGTRAAYTFKGDELYVRARVISSKLKQNGWREGEYESAWVQPARRSATP